ncbi:hypothetical protein ACHAWF_006292 [Thalassiosira exigua]
MADVADRSHDPDLERRALLSLIRQSSEGVKVASASTASWSVPLKGWSDDASVPVCEWHGVTCHDDGGGGAGGDGPPGAVSALNLTSVGASGTLPTELGLLRELEVLELGHNSFRGSVPQELADLKHLKALDLTQCFLTGTLPQRFASSRLTSLRLANNAISGRFFGEGDAAHLGSIAEIRMENNLLTGTLHGPALEKMTRLKTLSLSDNDLSGLVPGSSLGTLANLRHLYLDANSFVGPLPPRLAREGGPRLLELWLQDNALSGTVPGSYARFDGLRDFYIDGNKLTGAVPPGICTPIVNADFFRGVPAETERNYCDSIACPPGTTALEGLYPCTKCPGGEAARLKNRYLGRKGQCVDYSQREILRLFHEATTKGGPWGGDDWSDEGRPVCVMSGVTCDKHENVVGIDLKNRGLEGHVPDEIGLLPFLETLALSGNKLMGYVPGDLRWTSLERLDLSENKLRGVIPPLLCRTEGINGNGEGGLFHCDRIACPAGTYNDVGYHSGADGEPCRPCDGSDSPYIGQKACASTPPQQPASGWKETLQNAIEASGRGKGVSRGVGWGALALVLCASLLVVVSRLRGRRPRPQRTREGREVDAILSRSFGEDGGASWDDPQEVQRSPFRNGGQLEEVYDDLRARSLAGRPPALASSGDLTPGGHCSDSSDDGYSFTPRSATDFVNDHRGIALNRRERLRRAVSERVSSGDLDRRARDAASSINVGARRRLHGANVKFVTSHGELP